MKCRILLMFRAALPIIFVERNWPRAAASILGAWTAAARIPLGGMRTRVCAKIENSRIELWFGVSFTPCLGADEEN